MNRTITYPGALPKSADFLNSQRNAMIAAGAILQAVFGTSAIASGFTCTALSVPGMGVQVSAGALTQYTAVDATAYGELAADLTESIVKQGINLDPTILNMGAPTTAGQSIAYLVEGTFAEVDGTAVVLPYVNAANPSQPYAGPTNSGAAQNTTRDQSVTLTVKAGAAAATGSQTAPAADSGSVPLFVVTVAYGQTAITSASIAQHPSAPFPPYTLQQLSPGFSHQQVFTASGTWTAPTGVTSVKLRVWGAGGGGGYASGTNQAGGSGGGGGYAEGIFNVTPGTTYTVTVGSGGTDGTSSSNAGGAGGTSSFGALISATGGSGGSYNGASAGAGGSGTGGILNLTGQNGGSFWTNNSGVPCAAGGGGTFGTPPSQPVTSNPGYAGFVPGGGATGGSCASGANNGGAGARGQIIVEW